MSDVVYMGTVDHSLAERRARRDRASDVDRPSLADLAREASALPFGHPRRTFLLREHARVVRERQLDATRATVPPDGPAAA